MLAAGWRRDAKGQDDGARVTEEVLQRTSILPGDFSRISSTLHSSTGVYPQVTVSVKMI